jgi:sec-independent protein translocase protein TatA
MHSTALLFISNLFSSDMVIIMIIALFLFGGEKLPEIARGLGKGIRDFKDASEGVKREINEQINNYERKAEEKKAEETMIAQQATATQNQLPAHDESSAESLIRPANSVPVSGADYNGTVHHDAGDKETNIDNLVSENHTDATHVHNGTSAT